MSSLLEQLSKVLPEVLPATPGTAVNGTELMELVRPKLEGDYADGTIRVHFSRMAADGTSVIAKVDSGHGYYLRKEQAAPANFPPAEHGLTSGGSGSQEGAGIGTQPEEKFRALFMKYAEFENRFAMRIDHTRAQRVSAGVNKWKFPDVVVLDWDVGQVNDDGYRLDRNLLEVKRSLGEQPFRLTSVELKVGLNLTNFREHFFQCVSNSKWAHHSVLGVAYPVTDNTLVEELQRLGASYDVTIVSYSLDSNQLLGWPPADQIMAMSDPEFDELAKSVKLSTIATGRQRPGLDWEHIKDMRDQTNDFVVLFEWIARCLKEGRPFKHADFLDITEIQRRYA